MNSTFTCQTILTLNKHTKKSVNILHRVSTNTANGPNITHTAMKYWNSNVKGCARDCARVAHVSVGVIGYLGGVLHPAGPSSGQADSSLGT